MSENIDNDIKTLKAICIRLEENSHDSEWDLCRGEYDDLYEITGLEDHDWDENVLAHYIDGMQRAKKYFTY